MHNLQKLLESESINVYEPLAEFLKGDKSEVYFRIQLIDVARFSGHLCRSVTSAFLLTRTATKHLFDNDVLKRGAVSIRLGGQKPHGAQGPISQVMSYLSGAWGESGFGGLVGQRFVRKNLLSYSTDIPDEHYEFQNNENGKTILLKMNFNLLPKADPSLEFQDVWRSQISHMLQNSDEYVDAL